MLGIYIGLGITIILVIIAIILEIIRVNCLKQTNKREEYCSCLNGGCCDECLYRKENDIENLEYQNYKKGRQPGPGDQMFNFEFQTGRQKPHSFLTKEQ